MLLRDDIVQGSEEWLKARLGKITGSGFNKLMGTKEAREKYLCDKANEIVTESGCDGDCFSTIHTVRGHEFEEIARMKYTLATDNEIKTIGLVEFSEYVLCSPDGLVGDEGLIEIKVPDSNNYFRQILEISKHGSKAIPKEHYYQMQLNMFVCGRSWCDYVLYNPKHEAQGKSLYIHRVTLDMKENIMDILNEAIAKIQEYVNAYHAIIQDKNDE